MSAWAVMRHPDIAVPGIVPAGAVAMHEANGWARVSEFRAEPDFHLPDYDVDPAPAPAARPKPEPKKAQDAPESDEEK